MPHVEAEDDAAWDHVPRARNDLELADRGDDTVLAACGGFDRCHELGCRAQGVAAQRHRHRAGVPRLTGEHDAPSGLTGDRRDDAERNTVGLEHRALLDVDLVVADQIGGLASGTRESLRVAAEGTHCFGQAHAVGIAALERCAVEPAGQNAAAKITSSEADAFLVGERDDLDGIWQ